MLSTMTDEGDGDRSEREVLVPWLKFLWETYRSVLDILKTNSKLEKVYHQTAQRAFEFCVQHERKTEMRRLCETLRHHLSNLQRATAQGNTNRLRGWEGWTQEGIELHLATRFAQLEAASAQELWTEGFRTVRRHPPGHAHQQKAAEGQAPGEYYERLTKIFWVSGNYLFHAYAWWRHAQLAKESQKRRRPWKIKSRWPAPSYYRPWPSRRLGRRARRARFRPVGRSGRRRRREDGADGHFVRLSGPSHEGGLAGRDRGRR